MSKPSLSYRRSAVESLGSSSRSLNQLIRIVSPLPWIMMTTVYTILSALLIWSFFGQVPTYVSGQGVLIAEAGSIYSATAPEGIGRVVSILLEPGDQVNKGEEVAVLELADLEKQVGASSAYLLELREKLEKLTNKAHEKRRERGYQIGEQNAILHRMMETEEKNLANLTELVSIKRESFADGIETKKSLIESLSEFYRSQSAIEQYKDRLTQNDINESEYADSWEQRIMALNLKIDEARYQLRNLEERLALSKVVRSPTDGTVVGVQTSIGDMVKDGSPVASIASLGSGIDALVYVPAQVGKLVKPGMTALVSPSTVKREEFGSIKGEIKTVSQFPTTKKAMMAILQNQDLVDYLAAKGPPIAVRVRLISDSATYSGYAWTSSAGPEQQITPGSLANARITVRKQAPISLIIPALRTLTEG
jgi:HlyD family secretion protein